MRTTLTLVLLFVAVAGPVVVCLALTLFALPGLVLLERALTYDPEGDE
jgi:hypothetical protein